MLVFLYDVCCNNIVIDIHNYGCILPQQNHLRPIQHWYVNFYNMIVGHQTPLIDQAITGMMTNTFIIIPMRWFGLTRLWMQQEQIFVRHALPYLHLSLRFRG